jgi:catechol 2,3-dioxygenase-like lactoylglutathione lyase family enzyme
VGQSFWGFLVIALLGYLGMSTAAAEVNEQDAQGFVITRELVVRASPDEVYAAFDGDVREWWDHTFSESPKALYFETKPGGGFYEIFDDDGNGVQHATVIVAQPGNLLRFVGPLGFSGNALYMVRTLDFEPHAEGTNLKVTIQATGRIEEGWAEAVDRVWKHFLDDQLKPYVESGQAGGGQR